MNLRTKAAAYAPNGRMSVMCEISHTKGNNNAKTFILSKATKIFFYVYEMFVNM